MYMMLGAKHQYELKKRKKRNSNKLSQGKSEEQCLQIEENNFFEVLKDMAVVPHCHLLFLRPVPYYLPGKKPLSIYVKLIMLC